MNEIKKGKLRGGQRIGSAQCRRRLACVRAGRGNCTCSLRGIVRFALKYPHTVYVLAALILFLGVTAAVEMPTDIFPEIDIPVVSVIWQYTGLSTTEMEQRFTTYA
jgi:AcrB/AcrD/AcrF family protein